MTKLSLTGCAVVAVVAAGMVWAAPAPAEEAAVTSLRGESEIAETREVDELRKLNTGQVFGRAYRQQPPLIPHKIDKYQINLKVNQCLRCHDWPFNVDEGAPKVSETHYLDRKGVALDEVSGSRWFCTQCHVPQAQARSLIDNEFKSVYELD